MKITFSKTVDMAGKTAVFLCFENKELTKSAAAFDDQCGGLLTKALKVNRFEGKVKETLVLNAPVGVDANRVVLLGLGDKTKLTPQLLEECGASIFAALTSSPDTNAVLTVDSLGLSIQDGDVAAHLGTGAVLRSWRFDKYHTKLGADKKPSLTHMDIATPAFDGATVAFDRLSKVSDGVFLTRTLVSEPPNVIYPETLAAQFSTLSDMGVKVRVFDVDAMKKMGMNALLGVGLGSARDPRLVVLEWHGAGDDSAPIAFVGKGVTFDTGGISLKPAAGMESMKFDMGGAGVVGGLFKALAGRKAKVNAVGVVGLVENMPSGTAQRPSDVVVSMSGQTIEILNTDAEGRLVLADALWYTQQEFKPKFMVDLATLTGAIGVALGNHNAGLFSNNDELATRLFDAGNAVGETVWRMPLSEKYDRDTDSTIADVQNVGNGKAGSITAAQFLQRFVNNVPWAHLDIASMAWADKALSLCEKGATAFGVRLLNHLVQTHYES